MRLRCCTGLVAGLVLTVLGPPAIAAGPTVKVRVEGENGTLLERTQVTLSGNAVPGNSECDGNSAGAAIEAAVQGNWDRAPNGFTTTILGESHDFSRMDYWAEWLDKGAGYERGGGVCADDVAEGDEVLMLVDMPPYGEGSTTELPLSLRGVPAQVRRATDFTVTVVGAKTTTQYGDPGDGSDEPVAGATVAGAGASAITGADGRATLHLDQAGTVTLKATKTGDVPSAGEVVSVTEQAVTPAATPTPVPDTGAPVTRIEGIREQQHFSRRRAPRTLHGKVEPDPSGVRTVELSLTRSRAGRCSSYSATRERFRSARCGRRTYFGIGDGEEWSYLLPHRLAPGRYVLDALAVDGAGNRDRLARGRSRVVFFVR